MKSKHPLTIILLTFNEEDNIRACLDSVKDVQANRFVVDSFSTDSTLAILDEYDVLYQQHVFQNYSAQRNWAQENNPFASEWILHLDAGERATPNLVRWLNQEFKSNDTKIDGYLIARRAVFMGRWIRHGSYHPIYQLRLTRKGTARCEFKAYDQHFISTGKVETTPKDADLEDMVMNNIRDFTISHARWAIYEAAETIYNESVVLSGELPAKLFGSPIERRRWFKKNIFQKTPLFVRSFFYFLYRYFFKLGFLDGKEGLVFHVLQGFWFRFLVDATIFEIRKDLEHQPLELILQKKYNLKLASVLGKATENE
jgi:glycosyltransferase involved in cell wall biosynthesis